MTPGPKPTWAGRIPGGLAPAAWDFLHSLPHDRFLWPYDVRGTIAHVRGLQDADVLTAQEAASLVETLEEIADAAHLIDDADEDVHSAIERVLTERLGPLGAKVHAGRSRNDQVATALRLWAREAAADCAEAASALIAVLLDRAEGSLDVLVPGYTHLQRAQPVTLAHWLCAHAHALERDVDRLRAAAAAAAVSPLGAGALAGSTLGVDPRVAARELGFPAVFGNSLDAVSDRDFLADAAYACTMTLVHLSRLAEEIVLWASTEFGFLRLPDDHATGSSMMPQKRNPDVAELARGQSGRAIGALTGLLATLKGLPLAYDRDLQTDKEHVRGLFVTTAGALRATAGLIAGASFDTERLAAAASDEGLLATDLAEALVAAGVPFRDAHERVASLVTQSLDAGRSLAETVRDRPDAVAPVAAEDAAALLDPRGALGRRKTTGGPSPASVRAQIRRLRRRG